MLLCLESFSILNYSMSTIVEKYPPISLLLSIETYLYCSSLIEFRQIQIMLKMPYLQAFQALTKKPLGTFTPV